MIINTFEQALKLANEFLVTKERKNFYEFECIDEMFDKSVCYANELSDDEVSKIKQLKENTPRTMFCILMKFLMPLMIYAIFLKVKNSFPLIRIM